METFDFQRYIAEHREADGDSRSLTVGSYAFRGDVKSLRTLHGLTPVRLLTAATNRLWSTWGRKEVLKDAEKVREGGTGRVFEISRRCQLALGLASQIVYIAPHLRDAAVKPLGNEDELFVAVHRESVKSLSDAALTFLIGRALGHVQNGHVTYHTAEFYSDKVAGSVVRWALTPALVALRRWLRLSELTADRAGLLCVRNLQIASDEIIREAVGRARLEGDADIDLEAFKKGLEAPVESPRFSGLLERHAHVRVRLDALEVFSQSQYYFDHIGESGKMGLTLTQVDDEVEAMLRGDQRAQRSTGGE